MEILGSTVFTDNLGASVAQNITVNNDMLITPTNKLIATNIDAVAINNVNNPYGLRVLTDESTITSGSDILVTPNNLFKVYGAIQSDSYQPLTIGGDITLATTATANVLLNNLKANKIIAYPGNDLIFTTDATQSVRMSSLQASSIAGFDDIMLISNFKTGTTKIMTVKSNYLTLDGNFIYIGLTDINSQTVIRNSGLRFGTTGNALLNAYEVDS